MTHKTLSHVVSYIFFFFQAEDGIRDKLVTGVQTCALPICRGIAAITENDEVERSRTGSTKMRGAPRRYFQSIHRNPIDVVGRRLQSGNIGLILNEVLSHACVGRCENAALRRYAIEVDAVRAALNDSSTGFKSRP